MDLIYSFVSSRFDPDIPVVEPFILGMVVFVLHMLVIQLLRLRFNDGRKQIPFDVFFHYIHSYLAFRKIKKWNRYIRRLVKILFPDFTLLVINCAIVLLLYLLFFTSSQDRWIWKLNLVLRTYFRAGLLIMAYDLFVQSHFRGDTVFSFRFIFLFVLVTTVSWIIIVLRPTELIFLFLLSLTNTSGYGMKRLLRGNNIVLPPGHSNFSEWQSITLDIIEQHKPRGSDTQSEYRWILRPLARKLGKRWLEWVQDNPSKYIVGSYFLEDIHPDEW